VDIKSLLRKMPKKPNFKPVEPDIPLDEEIKICFEPIMGGDDFNLADVASVCEMEAMTTFLR
jgi:hypothetical protein